MFNIRRYNGTKPSPYYMLGCSVETWDLAVYYAFKYNNPDVPIQAANCIAGIGAFGYSKPGSPLTQGLPQAPGPMSYRIERTGEQFADWMPPELIASEIKLLTYQPR